MRNRSYEHDCLINGKCNCKSHNYDLEQLKFEYHTVSDKIQITKRGASIDG